MARVLEWMAGKVTAATQSTVVMVSQSAASFFGGEEHLKGFLWGVLEQYMHPDHFSKDNIVVEADNGRVSLINLVFKESFIYMLTGFPIALETPGVERSGEVTPHVKEIKLVRCRVRDPSM